MRRPQDHCGVVAVWGPPAASRLVHAGLVALQHRGQESAGVASGDGQTLHLHRGMGLVSEVFAGVDLDALPGRLAIGHVRYSTTGSSSLANAQPLLVRTRLGPLAVAQNGNLTNAAALRGELEAAGAVFASSNDTEVLAHLVAKAAGDDLVAAVAASAPRLAGGYAFVLASPTRVFGLRDPHGIRPLCLGQGDGWWVLASESAALDTLGARFVREVAPGELVVVDEDGVASHQVLAPGRPALCIFEFVYFARADSHFAGITVYEARKRLGRRLAEDSPVAADVVVGVPYSSLAAALGYAEASGIPYDHGLVANRYVGRTFISPESSQREAGVRQKLAALPSVVSGRRVVLVDDSIVRGTTSRHIVRLLREAGAREVHLRISSAPYRSPCYYGIDTSSRSELIAASRSVEAVRRQVDADSLAFLDVEAMAAAVGMPRDRFCTACFDCDYPVPVDAAAGKLALEGKRL